MVKRHAGKIVLSEKWLAEGLGYRGGKLHFVGKTEDYLGVCVVIEHADMPEVQEGVMVPRVDLVSYRLIPDTDYLAGGGLLRRLRESWRAFKAIWQFMAKEGVLRKIW